jgi:hypothetical protein
LGDEGFAELCTLFRDTALKRTLTSLFVIDNNLTNPQMDVLGHMPNLRNLTIMEGNQLGLPLPPWMQTMEDRPVLNYMRQAAAVRDSAHTDFEGAVSFQLGGETSRVS